MKKSELRKIIRESIKELITEQTSLIYMSAASCGQGSTTDTQGCVPMNIASQVGDTFSVTYFGSTRTFFIKKVHQSGITQCPAGAVPMSNYQTTNPGNCPRCCLSPGIPPGWDPNNTHPYYQSTPGGACWVACGNPSPCTSYGCTDPTATNYNATILPNCDQGCVWLGCTDSTASNYDPVATIDDGSCITAAGGCDPSAWSNHSNWTSTFTNIVANNFTNNYITLNPNPCNFLNNKIATWTANLTTAGPNQQNQLQCKLDFANQLHTQNNC
jgi:hypothetical protein